MGIKILSQRFTKHSPPWPEGCRWCGIPAREHAQLWWVPSRRWHHFSAPTTEQLIARKRAWNKIKGYS